MMDGWQVGHTDRARTGATAHESNHGWWLELEGVAELSGRTVGWLWAVPKSKSTCWGATIIQRLPPLQPSWHTSWATCQERILPPLPSRNAPSRSSTTNPLKLEPVLPLQTSARFQRLLCLQSVRELDTSSCSMWATGLGPVRKFTENTAEWKSGRSELQVLFVSHS